MGYLKQPRTILDIGQPPAPAILITGFSNLGHATNLPQQRRNRSFEFLNDVSWQHAIIDDEIRRRRSILSISRLAGSVQPRPVSVHRRNFYGKCARESAAGIADERASSDRKHDRDFRTWTTSFYVQHEWRPLRNVSVNAGLRYDYQTPFHEAKSLVANFDAVDGRVSRVAEVALRCRLEQFRSAGRGGLAASDKSRRSRRLRHFLRHARGRRQPVPAWPESAVRSLRCEEQRPRRCRSSISRPHFKTRFTSVQPSIFSASRQLPNPYLQQWNASVEYPVRQFAVVSVCLFRPERELACAVK